MLKLNFTKTFPQRAILELQEDIISPSAELQNCAMILPEEQSRHYSQSPVAEAVLRKDITPKAELQKRN